MTTDFERAFAGALLQAPDAVLAGTTPAFARQAAFAVYRNNVAAACIDALAANYPTVHQIVGDPWFRDAAGVFLRSHPPEESRLSFHGAAFATFLDAFEPAWELPYLAGVARLDRFWTEAHLAADAPVLEISALSSWGPDRLVAEVLVPHPAARWAQFAEAPVFTIWRRHREASDIGAEMAWHGEAALLARPAGVVTWEAVGPAACDFLARCRAGQPFGDAIAESGLPPGDLPHLLAAGAFAAFPTSPD